MALASTRADSDTVGASSRRGTWLTRIVPEAGLLRFSPLADCRRDLIASLTLAGYLIPAGMGDASLAGLSPEAGLYACVYGGLVFWAFSSSRHTTITVTSAISLLVGTSIGPIAGGDPTRFAALAACTAVLVAVIAAVAWAIRAGALVHFISETVLLGFKFGVALHLIAGQLPKLLGMPSSHGNFWERCHHVLQNLPDGHPTTALVGLGAILLLGGGKWLFPNRPVALVVMVGAIGMSAWLGLGDRGVKLLQPMPSGVPAPTLPGVGLADVQDLLPLAFACFLLGAVETVAIGRTFALKHGYRLNANREFLGLAWANLASGVGSGYPISGGMSQSVVNESAGARTGRSGLFAAVWVLLVVWFLSGVLSHLPQAVLAAIVIVAVNGLIKVGELQKLWRFSRSEFLVALVALLGVLGTGLLFGVLVGVVLSMLVLVRRVASPRVSELGRVPGTDVFADCERHPENQRVPGVLIFRVNSSLLFFNVEHVREHIDLLLSRRADPIRQVIFHLGTTPLVDLAGAEMVRSLRDSLRSRHIGFDLAEAHGPIRDSLRRIGLESEGFEIVANRTIPDLLSKM